MRIVVVGGDTDHIAAVARELSEHDLAWHLDHVASDADVPAAGSDGAPDVIVCASRVGDRAGLPLR